MQHKFEKFVCFTSKYLTKYSSVNDLDYYKTTKKQLYKEKFREEDQIFIADKLFRLRHISVCIRIVYPMANKNIETQNIL